MIQSLTLPQFVFPLYGGQGIDDIDINSDAITWMVAKMVTALNNYKQEYTIYGGAGETL